MKPPYSFIAYLVTIWAGSLTGVFDQVYPGYSTQSSITLVMLSPFYVPLFSALGMALHISVFALVVFGLVLLLLGHLFPLCGRILRYFSLVTFFFSGLLSVAVIASF